MTNIIITTREMELEDELRLYKSALLKAHDEVKYLLDKLEKLQKLNAELMAQRSKLEASDVPPYFRGN